MSTPREKWMLKKEVPGLTGLRGLAAASVVLGHSQLSGFELSFLAVDVFFLLSGYVLATVYHDHCDTKEFFLARAARTLPVHIVVELAAAVVFGHTLWQFLSDLLLVGVPWFGAGSGILWSLAIEWYAYLLFPVAIVTIRRVRPSVAAAFSIFLIVAGWIEPSEHWASSVFSGHGAVYGPHALARGLGTFGLGMAIQMSGWRPQRSLLDAAPLRWLGDISYPLYLAHPLGFQLGSVFLDPSASLFGAIIGIGASVLIAAALHYVVENPARRRLRRLGAPAETVPPGISAAQSAV
jgi:peptidoglycan/LPS O-acetylase OafA/YrhL